ncbi:MAG: DUF3604 domain-containing protein [Kiritimatiellae bacterium]|nr:DUF3604 domain-containing protein [Kiritimatiellia bacterium]
MNNYRLFWGDTHHNTYQFGPQDPAMDVICREATEYLDFYASAYYTGTTGAFKPGGHPAEVEGKQELIVEACKADARLQREWGEMQDAMRAHNRPGSFVTFPGYEWQGNGAWGDHNVFYKQEGLPVYAVRTIEELYACLRGKEAIAIPHHTGYRPGCRAPDWSRCDETLSPFTELFSKHGCSETDEEWIGLRHNSHMGPGAGGSTYADALERGLHIGCIASTDNWSNTPAQYGGGMMACWATELSRDGLWDAFLARRVYGVTGDRIELAFTVNGAPMGSRLGPAPKRAIRVAVRGADALDRIEILRNNRVIHTHCHQGTWGWPAAGTRARFKLRVECGWGPRPNELPLPDRRWDGEFALADGRFLSWQPCWVMRGQHAPRLNGGKAAFTLTSSRAQVLAPAQNGNVFEFEAAPETHLRLALNGLAEDGPVRAFGERSRILWYRDECVRLLAETCGLVRAECERDDPFYHMAYKAKLHRLIPEAGYSAELELEDDEPLSREAHYRVRVEQRNGQRAWSSPVWVKAQ